MTPRTLSALLPAVALCLAAACASKPAPDAQSEPAMKTAEHAHTHKDHAHNDHAHNDHAHHHDFSDVDKWVKHFESPERESWQKPAHVVSLMAISPGMTVVDLGAGTGYFTQHLRQAAGGEGQVIALDVAKELVAHINERAKTSGWENVIARQIPFDDPQLEPASVDRVLLVDTWHHIQDREPYAKKLAQALKPGGTITIVEVTAQSARRGPPASMRVSPEVVTRELSGAGLSVSLVPSELTEQYVLRAQKPQ